MRTYQKYNKRDRLPLVAGELSQYLLLLSHWPLFKYRGLVNSCALQESAALLL